MEAKPESEEIFAYTEKVSPGWVYDAATKEFSPGEATPFIRVEECPPSREVDIKKSAELSKLGTSEIIRKDCSWFQDFKANLSGYAMLLLGSKTIVKKGLNVKPHHEKRVVSSVHYRSYIEILMFFKCPMEDEAKMELNKYIEATLTSTSPIIIPTLIYDNFLNAYIYERGKRKEITSLKHGLQEFCRYLGQSEVSKFPYMTTVLKPIPAPPPVSYASVAKNEPRKIRAESQNTLHNSHWASHSTGKEMQPNYHSSSTSNAGIGLPAVHWGQRNCHKLSGSQTTLVQNYGKKEESKCSGLKTPEKGYDLRPRQEKPLRLDHAKKLRPASHLMDEEWKVKGYKSTSAVMDEEIDNSCISSSFGRTSEEIEDRKVHKPALKNCNNGHYSDNSNRFTQTEECESKLRVSCDKKILRKKAEDRNLNIRRVDGSTEQSSTFLNPIEQYEICGTQSKHYIVRGKGKGKSIILLGASGSGKTTLVNFIANYFSGINPVDGRLVHVATSSNDAQAHTTSIITYTFCADEDDEPLTVIDTPGLNDSSGAEVRDHVQSLKTFLANSGSEKMEIHAIGFVAQAHIVRLTSSERLVMDYVTNLFGAEIRDHIVTFITFADGQETPPVVEAMKSYGVSCNLFLKFNNSALSSSKGEEVDDLDKIYWRIGCKSWRKFLKYLSKLPPLSLDVLKTLHSEVYVTQIMASAERDLKTELTALVKYYKKDKYSQEACAARERVWHLATSVNQLKCLNSSGCVNVESTLVTYSEEVYKETGLSVQPFIVFLSLAPSRALFKAGLGIIESIAPIYYKLTTKGNSQNMNQAKMNYILFCHGCQKDHIVERELVKPSWLQLFGIRDVPIVYSCSQCSCAGGLHGEKEEVAPDSCSLYPNYLLKHTRDCIKQILRDYCLPGYEANEKEFIQYLKLFVEHQSQLLCSKLLSKE